MRAQISDLKNLTAIMTGELKGQETWDFLTQARKRRVPFTDEQVRNLDGIRQPPSADR